MNNKERTAMQQALEALEQYQFDYCWDSKVNATITALREALDHFRAVIAADREKNK